MALGAGGREPGRGRERGRRELWLLLMAWVVGTAAWAQVELGAGVSPLGALRGALLALPFLLGSGLVARRFAPRADPVILPTAAVLVGLGSAAVHRIDLAEGTHLARLQLQWAGLSMLAFLGTLVLVRDYVSLDRYRYTWMLVALALLLSPLLPGIGRTVNGARLWVHFGPFQFQPQEAAKVAAVVFFSSYLAEKGEVIRVAGPRFGFLRLPPLRFLAPLLILWGLSISLLVLQRDLGSSVLIFLIFLALLYLATGGWGYLAGGLGLLALGIAWAGRTFGHVRTRIAVWIDPWKDPRGSGYQILQALFALASGGVIGAGLGKGRPDAIPFVATDFIVAAIGEELGLVGLVGLVAAYLVLVGRGLSAAVRAREEFGKLLAAGLSLGLGLQALVIMAGVGRLLPVTGLVLPFVAYGGSSLVAGAVVLALLYRITEQVEEEAGVSG